MSISAFQIYSCPQVTWLLGHFLVLRFGKYVVSLRARNNYKSNALY